MRTTHALIACAAVLAAAASLATAAAWADVPNPPSPSSKPTEGCPVPGMSAVCPRYKRVHVRGRLAERGIEKREYMPGVWAYLRVNASTFGTAAASTAPALNAYAGGANEAGFHFHDTEPAALKFHPTEDFDSFGRAFTAARFLDVASTKDAPPPTQNSMIKTCKTGRSTVWVANFTSATPFPGPPTGATVLAHAKALAARLDEAGERYCSRSAWLLSYSPDSQATGRKLFEVSLDAGRCRSGADDDCSEKEEDEKDVGAVPRPALVVDVGAE